MIHQGTHKGRWRTLHGWRRLAVESLEARYALSGLGLGVTPDLHVAVDAESAQAVCETPLPTTDDVIAETPVCVIDASSFSREHPSDEYPERAVAGGEEWEGLDDHPEWLFRNLGAADDAPSIGSIDDDLPQESMSADSEGDLPDDSLAEIHMMYMLSSLDGDVAAEFPDVASDDESDILYTLGDLGIPSQFTPWQPDASVNQPLVSVSDGSESNGAGTLGVELQKDFFAWYGQREDYAQAPLARLRRRLSA